MKKLAFCRWIHFNLRSNIFSGPPGSDRPRMDRPLAGDRGTCVRIQRCSQGIRRHIYLPPVISEVLHKFETATTRTRDLCSPVC